MDSGATHVVTGIDFGARACVEFYIEDDDSRIETSISGQLEANIRGLLQGDAEMNLREVEACRSKNVKCRVTADCLSGPICDVSSVRKFIEEFGSKVEQSGGVPCTVYMMPLSAFCNDIVIIMNAIEETSLQIVKEYMELYDACKRKLRSLALYSELNYLQEHCNTLSSRLDNSRSYFARCIADILPRMRSGQIGDGPARLSALVQDICASEHNPRDLHHKIFHYVNALIML